MSLSLKKEKMIEYLNCAKAPDESFTCMLWGTVFADISRFQNRAVVSLVMAFTPTPGVAGSLDNAFCYIGLTEKTLYVIALDTYNTTKITGTFALPLVHITALTLRKGLLGVSYTVEIVCGEYISLTVKGLWLGTDIKDQKERMGTFVSRIEALKTSISG